MLSAISSVGVAYLRGNEVAIVLLQVEWERDVREVAGRRQSRFAECLARRAKGDAIVSDGWRIME